MRFLNIIIVFLIAFSFGGIALYAIGPNLSSEAVAQKAFAELERSGKMEDMIRQIEGDPAVSRYMEELEGQSEFSDEVEESGMDEQLDEELADDVADIEADTAAPETDKEELAFETKEDAASVMMEKVGFRNLLKMKNAVENDTMTAEQVMNELDDDLNEEEMLALKVMIFKEWQNRN